eukprot:887915_1
MMSMISIIYSLLLFTLCHSHMSLQYPYTRHIDTNGIEYAKWESNEPMIPMRPRICHGLPSESTINPANQFAVGDTITIYIYGSAEHFGGHCSFWVSTNDITFTKIVDIKDCTLNPTTTQVTLPDTLPIECSNKCTFAWTWIPAESALCEIYNNCADISVSGLTGNMEYNPQIINFNHLINAPNFNLCQRVNPTSHWSNTFMPLKLQVNTPMLQHQPNNIIGGINFENNGEITVWHYSAIITNLANGYNIAALQVGSNGKYKYCTDAKYWKQLVYSCNPSSGLQQGFVYPLDVRILASNGEIIERWNVISNIINTPQDIGINFGQYHHQY